MFFIPGIIITVLTFPGVIVHELAHQLFCRICRVSVFDVCYFKLANPCGYVVHEIPKNSFQQILIGIGPFFVNTILGALIALPAVIPILNFNAQFGEKQLLYYFLIWVGVSIAMHSFPSTGDAKGIWKEVRSNQTSILTKIIGAPIVLFIYIGAIGSAFWLDLAYGIAVVAFLPNLIIKLIS